MVVFLGLQVVIGAKQGYCYFPGIGEYVIGKQKNAELHIRDPYISPKHAKLKCSGKGLFIEDLGSTSGTFVNGKIVLNPMLLKTNDIVKLGKTEFKIILLPGGELRPKPNTIKERKPGQEMTIFKMGNYRITPLRLIVLFITGFGILLGGSILTLFFASFIGIKNPKALTLGIFLASLPLLPYLYVIHILDYHRRISFFFLMSTLVWGGIVAAGASLLLNSMLKIFLNALGISLSSVTSIHTLFFVSGIAPIVEETIKGLGLLLLFIFLKQRFTNTLDGLLYGFAIGLGFALVENILYFSQIAMYTSQITLRSVFLAKSQLGSVFYMRSLFLASICHPAWTGIIGFGFGIIRERPKDRFRFVYPFLAFFIAVLLHSLWNGIGVVKPVSTVKQAILTRLLSAGILAGAVVILQIAWAYRKEQQIVKKYLSDLVDPNIITKEELKYLSLLGRGYVKGIKELLHLGWRAFFLTRSLARLQVKLAFRRWQLSLDNASIEEKRMDSIIKQTLDLIHFYRKQIRNYANE